MPGSNYKFLGDTLLACGHTTNLLPPPEIGDVVLCPRHFNYQVVTAVNWQWRAQCRGAVGSSGGGCRYARSFGAAKFNTYRSANRHLRENPSHRVIIWHGSSKIEELKNDQPVIARTDGAPYDCPF